MLSVEQTTVKINKMNMNTIELKWALREKQNRDTKIEQNNKMSCHDNKD